VKLRTIPLGRVGGCSVRLDPALVVALIYLEWQAAGRYPAGLLSALAVGGLILHELAHLLVIWLAGGRARQTVLTLLGGRWELDAPGRLAQVEWRAALAGPIVSITVGALLMAATNDTTDPRLERLFLDLGRFHSYLGLVNLAPAFPLDGGRALRALLARTSGIITATRMVSAVGKAMAVGCVVLAVYAKLVPLLFVGIFLYAGAVSEERHEWLVSPLEGVRVGDVVEAVSARMGVRNLAAEAVLELHRTGGDAMPVLADDGATLAAVSAADLRAVPPRRLWSTTLGELLPKLGRVVTIDADAARVQRGMIAARWQAVAVVDRAGDAIGALTIEAIERRVALYEIVGPEALEAKEPARVEVEAEVEVEVEVPAEQPAAASLSTPAA
jgi:Zn-dependent protease